MKRPPFAWLLGAAATFFIQHAASGFDGPGAGTAADPYRISTVGQLQEMRNALDAHYALAGDVDASATPAWNTEQGFEPVGSLEHPFTGGLDGQGFSIRGLNINRFAAVTRHIGLIGYAGPSAIIQHVKLEKGYVKGCDFVGLLVGMNFGAVTDCQASGQVFGSGTFGGLIGANNAPGVVTRCSAAVDVGPVWVGNHLGGLVGGNSGKIANCYATGTVQGQENPGGLVGVNNGGTILNCYAAGDVKSSFGGASEAYPRGAGGLVAQSLGGGKVSNCFATGQISAPAGLPVGGIIGLSMDDACLHNSYYLKRPGSPEAGVGKSLADSGPTQWEAVSEIDAAFFVPGKNLLGRWDFANTWTLDRSQPGTAYPRFKNCAVKP